MCDTQQLGLTVTAMMGLDPKQASFHSTAPNSPPILTVRVQISTPQRQPSRESGFSLRIEYHPGRERLERKRESGSETKQRVTWNQRNCKASNTHQMNHIVLIHREGKRM